MGVLSGESGVHFHFLTTQKTSAREISETTKRNEEDAWFGAFPGLRPFVVSLIHSAPQIYV